MSISHPSTLFSAESVSVVTIQALAKPVMLLDFATVGIAALLLASLVLAIFLMPMPWINAAYTDVRFLLQVPLHPPLHVVSRTRV